MTKRDDLQALHDAVKAGMATIGLMEPLAIAAFRDDAGSREPTFMHVWSAYRGSLDAAHALHKAALPGWEWKRVVHPGPIASVGVWEPPKFIMGQAVREVDDNPARAWLLAILAALIAMEGE